MHGQMPYASGDTFTATIWVVPVPVPAAACCTCGQLMIVFKFSACLSKLEPLI